MWGSEVNFVQVILRYLSMCPGDHTSSAGLHCNHHYTLIYNHIFLDWVIDICLQGKERTLNFSSDREPCFPTKISSEH